MAKIFFPYGEKRPVKPSNSGNRMEPHYIEVYDENGHPSLRQDGETDVYAQIQSYKDDCDIHVLLARYAAGDVSVMKSGGVYMDATQLPTSMHDIFNLMTEQRDKFNQLPLEIREKFGHSFETWAIQAGSPEWLDKMGLNKPAEAAEQKEAPADES